MLTPTANPLLAGAEIGGADLATLTVPTILDRPHRKAKRELLDLRRAANAEAAIAALTKRTELYGFTKGQFSVLDLIKACLNHTGPARFSISTWTAAQKEIVELEKLLADGALTGTRWLIDYTFARRDKAALHHIRKVFGADSVRVANTHSKFCIFENATWRLVLRSSMNLNMNPRFEDFTLAHDPEVADFLGAILDEIWTKQKKGPSPTPPSPAHSSGSSGAKCEAAPLAPAAQVTAWILAGASERDIREAIAATYPDAEATPLIVATMRYLEASAKRPANAVLGWCLEATRELYRRMLEIGDFPGALRAAKQMVDLIAAGRAKEPERWEPNARPQAKADAPESPARESGPAALGDGRPDDQSAQPAGTPRRRRKSRVAATGAGPPGAGAGHHD